MKTVNVAIVGCGVIAHEYAKDMAPVEFLTLRGAYDVDAERTKAFAEKHGGLAYDSLDDVLADPEVDVVVNLTLFKAHHGITKRALEAGKHVFSEKPLAGSVHEAVELVDVARSNGVRLSCAPVTFLGEAQERTRQEIRGGRVGKVRLVYAESNHGLIETWHPQPQSFYEVGPLRDVGVYPLGIVTNVLGPAARVSAYGTILKKDRLTKRGVPFQSVEHDFYVAMVEFPDGAVLRLTCNFYAPEQAKQKGVEFFGDDGQLHLGNWIAPSAAIEVAKYGEEYAPLPNYERTARKWSWATGLVDLGGAILENRPSRMTGEHAAHIVEILEGAHESIRTGRPVDLTTTFTPWADRAPELV